MNKENDIQINKVEETIKQRIFVIRGQKVMLDSDLAKLFSARFFNDLIAIDFLQILCFNLMIQKLNL